MQALTCHNCGAAGLRFERGQWVCDYCGSRFLPESPKAAAGSVQTYGTARGIPTHGGNSEIALDDDVQRLLDKCRTDRKNARKYANLILDIDPDNEEARKYL